MKTEFEIREAVPGDARELLAIYKPYVETTAITFEYEVPSRAEFEERIRHTKKKYPYLVACMRTQAPLREEQPMTGQWRPPFMCERDWEDRELAADCMLPWKTC